MDNIFAELQALVLNSENDIEDIRKDLRRIVDIFKSRDCYGEECSWFAEKTRNLKLETILKAEGFMVQPDVPATILPEELRHDSLGFCRDSFMVFEGRFVYPVKDIKGNVMGFCGYDAFSPIKYLDSTTYGYKAKVASVYGMETMPETYRSTGPVFFVEGIVCALYLRQNGLDAYATLGSYLTDYVIKIINRLGRRAIVVTDSDESGNKFRAQVKRCCPLARPLQSRVAKDIDDSRKVEPGIVDDLRRMNNPFYTSKYFK